MSWENSLKILNDEWSGRILTHLDSRTSSVTTSWGVDWDATNLTLKSPADNGALC
jgi:hypothetical protein